MTQVRPGWYRDPAGAPFDRWWDGGTWTTHTQPMGLSAYQQQAARSARATGALARLILWAVGIAAAVVVLVFIAAWISVATH